MRVLDLVLLRYYTPLGVLLQKFLSAWSDLIAKDKMDSHFFDTGMGVYSWKRTSMECFIFVYHLWDAIFGSQLAGVFTSRKSCKWVTSFDTDFCCLRDNCWFGHSSQGIFGANNPCKCLQSVCYKSSFTLMYSRYYVIDL